MKIACFYGDNPLASWSLSRGFPSVLRRMGHEVIEIPTLAGNKVRRSDAERINKPITGDVDLILVSGPEYLMTWIKTFYPRWKKLDRIPKACWYHESEKRDDRQADFSQIMPWFDYNFMPNAEDAERYGVEHLPVGVDTEIFKPQADAIIKIAAGAHVGASCDSKSDYVTWNTTTPRTIDVAFIGTLYKKREEFLRSAVQLMGDIQIRAGNSLVQDLDGINLVKSVELLASEYRRIKILLNLPTLSKVLVSKILEAAACGCCVLTPSPRYAEVGIGYESTPEALAERLKALVENPAFMEEQSRIDCERVHKEHRLELRMEKILAKVGQAVTVG